MILALGARGREFDSRITPFFSRFCFFDTVKQVLECNWLAPKVLILVIRVQVPVEPFCAEKLRTQKSFQKSFDIPHFFCRIWFFRGLRFLVPERCKSRLIR